MFKLSLNDEVTRVIGYPILRQLRIKKGKKTYVALLIFPINFYPIFK